MPVGLGNDAYAEAFGLDDAADDCSTETGMVDLGIGREDDNVDSVPTVEFHFAACGGNPIGELGHGQ